jgi:hypothetical protein
MKMADPGETFTDGTALFVLAGATIAEADAWRAGWRAAREAALELLRWEAAAAEGFTEEQAGIEDAIKAISAMEPPA